MRVGARRVAPCCSRSTRRCRCGSRRSRRACPSSATGPCPGPAYQTRRVCVPETSEVRSALPLRPAEAGQGAAGRGRRARRRCRRARRAWRSAGRPAAGRRCGRGRVGRPRRRAVPAAAPPPMTATAAAAGTTQRSAGRDVKIDIGCTSCRPSCAGVGCDALRAPVRRPAAAWHAVCTCGCWWWRTRRGWRRRCSAACRPRASRWTSPATGRAGLELARHGGYDAMILDVMLPGLSGYRVVPALRAEEQLAAGADAVGQGRRVRPGRRARLRRRRLPDQAVLLRGAAGPAARAAAPRRAGAAGGAAGRRPRPSTRPGAG